MDGEDLPNIGDLPGLPPIGPDSVEDLMEDEEEELDLEDLLEDVLETQAAEEMFAVTQTQREPAATGGECPRWPTPCAPLGVATRQPLSEQSCILFYSLLATRTAFAIIFTQSISSFAASTAVQISTGELLQDLPRTADGDSIDGRRLTLDQRKVYNAYVFLSF